MISYKDMTFCTFYEDCIKQHECHRPLTPEVLKAAEKWWGSPGAPISTFIAKPTCHARSKSMLHTQGEADEEKI